MQESVPRNEGAWAAWERIGAPRHVMAPMVDGSDLPFRALCRREGTQLCFAPMVSAKAFVQYVSSKRTLSPLFETEPGDRPLFFQMSGNDPALCARAALLAAPHVDGVDLNLGCPQHIASRSRYGAFLMGEPVVVEAVVRAMAAALAGTGCLVSIKIRVLPSLDETVAFARMLERAGCQVLTVHGRTKEQRGAHTGDADWAKVAAVKRAVGIPVIANGNIRCFQDVALCMRETGCDGVMSAWTLLRDPGLFSGPHEEASAAQEVARAREWVEWSAQYAGRGASLKRTKLHLFKRLFRSLQQRPELRELLANVGDDEELASFMALLQAWCASPLMPLPPVPPKVVKAVDASDDTWVLFEE